MIVFKNLSCGYEKNVEVLKDLSFTIEKGEAIGLIGANGAGKSTLMKALLGLMPYSGDILVDGLRVEKENLKEIRKRLGLVLQDPDDQMFMPRVLDDMTFGPMNYGMSRGEAEKKSDEILERLGLSELRERYNHKISGGEKRMAAIATVLAMEPEVLLMDEPSSNLDPYNRRQVINAVNSLSITKIIASHDIDMILDTCDRVILLSSGRIAADGPAEEILSDKALLEQNRMELPLRLQGR